MVPWNIRSRIRTFLLAALLGIVSGVFVWFPVNEFVYFEEYRPAGWSSGANFAADQLGDALRGEKPRKTVFYALVGILLNLTAAAVYTSMAKRAAKLEQMNRALGDDLHLLIGKGESANLEFKSSFRWDLKENRINRALETVVLKTLAGYMNGAGGTLLIGVADDGSILGLAPDYKALKKPDRDGFEQGLMTAVAAKLGGDACQNVHAFFHSIEQKEVCRVLVAPGHRPVYLRDGETPKLYVRMGVSTRELNVQEAINYTATRWKT